MLLDSFHQSLQKLIRTTYQAFLSSWKTTGNSAAYTQPYFKDANIVSQTLAVSFKIHEGFFFFFPLKVNNSLGGEKTACIKMLINNVINTSKKKLEAISIFSILEIVK